MQSWYSKVTNNPDNLEYLAEALEFFYKELSDGTEEIKPKGKMWDMAVRLPWIAQHRTSQLMEIEAIRDFFERKAMKAKIDKKRHYLEHYQRNLTERAAGEWAEADDEVLTLKEIVEQITLLRNKYAALTKGYEYLHFQMGHLVKLKQSGIEDAMF